MNMDRIIDSLPGVSMPVEEVTSTLTKMWDSLQQSDGKETDTRASQLNLVVHFGLSTTSDEAKEIFDTAVTFAQEYPCRIIVLCPSETATRDSGFEGKLFSQCYIGKSLREVCCCEALILGYSTEQSDFLESQVSIWLEADLPVYHWFHRVPPDRITRFYLPFIKRCRRILFDGEIDGDGLDQIPWPDKNRVSDLAFHRTLPIRQHLGQFLSGYSKEELVEGLSCLRIQYHLGMRRTAYQLMRWHRRAIEKCFSNPADADAVVFTVEQLVQEGTGCCMHIEWEFGSSKKYLKWDYNTSQMEGCIRARLSSEEVIHPLHIEPLKPEVTLPEAIFFG